MSNRLDMKKDTNNRKDKTKYDGPEKPDAYMGNDKQWVFRALVLAFVDMCIIAISFFFVFGGLSAHCAIVYGDFTCGVLYFQTLPQYMAFCEHQ